jgi:hypothetical protein
MERVQHDVQRPWDDGADGRLGLDLNNLPDHHCERDLKAVAEGDLLI